MCICCLQNSGHLPSEWQQGQVRGSPGSVAKSSWTLAWQITNPSQETSSLKKSKQQEHPVMGWCNTKQEVAEVVVQGVRPTKYDLPAAAGRNGDVCVSAAKLYPHEFAFGCKLAGKIPFPVIPEAVCAFIKAQQEFPRDRAMAGYTRSLGWVSAGKAFLCKTRSSSHSYLQSNSVAILGRVNSELPWEEWKSCDYGTLPAALLQLPLQICRTHQGLGTARDKNSRNASADL